MNEFIKWIKTWYNLLIDEQSELTELGEDYKEKYLALRSRVLELKEEVKKYEPRAYTPFHAVDKDSHGIHFEDEL